MTTDTDFDGCHRECRTKGRHSKVWGGCEFGIKPEPTVSMSKVYTDPADGLPSIGFDSYTVDQLTELIEPSLKDIRVHLGPNSTAAVRRGESFRFSGGEIWTIARQTAHAIVHRNDPGRPDLTPPFITRVMEIFSMSHADSYGDVFWRVDGFELKLYANVSDVFAWGGSDCEEITRETLPELERAYSDLKAVGGESFTAELYAARVRRMRPQGIAYPRADDEAAPAVAALLDACGPERTVDQGNPKERPVY
jgi:hypothetical protein